MAAVASKTDVFNSPIGTLSPAGVRCLLGGVINFKENPMFCKIPMFTFGERLIDYL